MVMLLTKKIHTSVEGPDCISHLSDPCSYVTSNTATLTIAIVKVSVLIVIYEQGSERWEIQHGRRRYLGVDFILVSLLV